VAPTPPDLITVLPPEAPAVAPTSAPAHEPPLATAAEGLTAPVGSAVAAPDTDAQAVMALFGFKCPFCRADIEVSIDCVGDRINCPACHRAFAVPQVGQQAKPDIKPAAKAVAASAEEQFVSFLCKSCGQEIEAPIDMAGSQDECPSCGSAILVPYISEPGTTQALRASSASQEALEAAKSRTLRIELPDDV
jgi:DNA-directed RNA polymerase subunit RPC12/RpoP